MAKPKKQHKKKAKQRRIALFVEGQTERNSLAQFFHNWLDPQLENKVGIQPVLFQGISRYLDDLADKIERNLSAGHVNFVVGLVDLYGFPPDHLELSQFTSVPEKVKRAREYVNGLVPKEYRHLFRQHFAVHEVEAWLLAYPDEWPQHMQKEIKKRKPETVNFTEPPAKFLQRLYKKGYKKTTAARNILHKVDPQIAIDNCPFLKILANDLLEIAKRLQ